MHRFFSTPGSSDWLPLFVAAAIALVVVAPYVRQGLVGWAYAAHRRGRGVPALALGRHLLHLPGRGPRLAGAWLLAAVRADRGETAAAVEATRIMLRQVDGDRRLSWRVVTDATNNLVNAGLYREAVLLPRKWSGRAREAARRKDPANHALAQVNRAEALHNLGRNASALRLLSRVEAEARQNALALEGLLCLRAWICSHTGDLLQATRDLAHIQGDALRRDYAPELHYARAKSALAAGRRHQARSQATRGLRSSVRAASERNGLFLLAEISAAEGETESALEYFQRGLAHRYRAQGGASLLGYADLLTELGRHSDAARAEELIVGRDPQSAAAAQVLRRRTAPPGTEAGDEPEAERSDATESGAAARRALECGNS